ncbi:MAG: LuxR C-terminal-related transcriptional regulator [Thermoanaerobaculia bacterium]
MGSDFPVRHLTSDVSGLFEALARSPDAVFVTDRRNRIVFSNRAAETLLGRAADEVPGTSCDLFLKGRDIFDNRYCTSNCSVMQMAARGEPVRSFRMRVAASDGSELTVEVTILHLAVPPPEHFLLVHLLRPLERVGPVPLPNEADVQPPRSPLEAVRESTDARARRLTAREVEVLGMLAAGRTTPEIASRLSISTLTVRNHIQNILEKLEVHSKSEAIAFAFQKRLI